MGPVQEEDGEESAGGGGLRVDLIGPRGGQCEFEPTEETECEHYEQQTEEDVEDSVGGERVEGAGSEDAGDGESEGEVDDDDGDAVGDGVLDAFLLIVLGALQEEADGHRDDGPHAGGEQGDEAAEQSHEEDVEERAALGAVLTVEGGELFDDGLPEVALGDSSRIGYGCYGAVGGCGCCHRVGLHLVGRLLLFLGLRVFLGCGGVGRAVAFVRELHGRGGHTVLVVASSILEVSGYIVGLASDLILLHEGDVVLEVTQFHAEEVVELTDFLALCLQAAYGLDTFFLLGGEGGGDRTVGRQTCGVDVPTRSNLTGEDNLQFGGRDLLLLYAEADGVLGECCHGEQGEHHRQSECFQILHCCLFGSLIVFYDAVFIVSCSCGS